MPLDGPVKKLALELSASFKINVSVFTNSSMRPLQKIDPVLSNFRISRKKGKILKVYGKATHLNNNKNECVI